ncbi:MAG TPA: hypothetical protein VFX97_18680 [Pyrinomonadaceae bacterium]|nr:hypothetical protein [Pyrinomonadaceae bacterium]
MLSRLIIRSAIVCFAVVTCASPLVAQNKKPKPDYTGTWLLDAQKSNSVGLTRRPDLPIKISHQDPELRITLTSEANGQLVERQTVYFTDGRGEENQATAMLTTNPNAPHDPQKGTRSTTRWSGNKIITRTLLQLQAGGRVIEFELVDEWKLSADGKTLTQTTKTVYLQSSGGAFIPAMAPDKKRVYNRV